MLDLGIYPIQTWEVKLPDGKVITVNEPTIKLNKKLADIINKLAKLSDEEQEKELLNLATIILNNNVEGINFTEEQVRKFANERIQTAIVNGYSEFINSIKQQKN